MQQHKYDEDFKRSIIIFYENDKLQTEPARKCGVLFLAISRWIRLYSIVKSDDVEILTAKQIKDLQKHLLQFEEKNIILKKRLPYFSTVLILTSSNT